MEKSHSIGQLVLNSVTTSFGGSVSGSSISTGSFGRVQTDGNVSVGDRLVLSRNQIQGFNYLGRLSSGR